MPSLECYKIILDKTIVNIRVNELIKSENGAVTSITQNNLTQECKVNDKYPAITIANCNIIIHTYNTCLKKF
jgi:hypothetical protein